MIKQSYHRTHPSKSKKRGSQSTRIIHISIRSKSNNSRSAPSQTNSRNLHRFKSSTVVVPDEKTQTARANVTDYTKKKKKKQYSNRRCLAKVLIALLILISIITIILAVLLTRTNTKRSNKEAILRWNSTGITVAGVTGQPGNTSDRISTPRGIDLDWSNALYITDEGNSRIQKYSRNALVGETVAGDGSGIAGTGAGLFSHPFDVVIDLNENVFVADTLNHRIQQWIRGSSTGTTIAGTTGVVSDSANTFNFPYGITYDSITHGIYVSDTANFRIMYYPPGVLNGSVVAGGNGQGLNNTQLGAQHSSYYDVVTNSLFISQCDTNNVIQWSLGASSWTLIAGYLNGTISNSSSGFSCARDVTLDPMSNIYVVDRDNRRVQFFSTGQRDGTTIAGINGITVANASSFSFPISVVLDTQLNLYVSDTVNHRIQKFMRY